MNNLSNEVFSNNDNGLQKFCKTTMDTLNLFAPTKKKYARGNQMPFMTKDLSKKMMTRSRLRNKYLKDKTEENRLLCTQQRSKCVSLLRKTKINYYGNLNLKDITDNKNSGKLLNLSYLISQKLVTKFILMNTGNYLIVSLKQQRY